MLEQQGDLARELAALRLELAAQAASNADRWADRECADAERENLLARAQHSREQAEAVSRSKDEFIALISHELRAPLNAMLGWAHVLKDGKADAAAQARCDVAPLPASIRLRSSNCRPMPCPCNTGSTAIGPIAGAKLTSQGLGEIFGAVSRSGAATGNLIVAALIAVPVAALVFRLAGAYFALGTKLHQYPESRWIALGAFVLVAAGLFLTPLLDRSLVRAAPRGRIARILARLVHAAADLAQSPGRLLLCLAISMAVQCLFVGINIAFAQAAHVDAPIAAWFFAWTTAKIIAIAPVSLGGLGVREASMAGLLLPFGADPGQVVAIGLIWQSVLYASGAIGFLVQLRRPKQGALGMEPS